jgi:drug/metabolite transporter (DMT)-like permease
MTAATEVARPSAPSVRTASFLAAFAACCFGSIPLFAIIATRDGATLIALLTWRYVLALVILGGVAGRAIVARENRAGSLPLVLVGGIVQAAIAYFTLAALEYLTAATLGFLFYTYPAWVAIIAAVRGTEPLTATRIGALALSLTGIVIMVGSPWAAAMPLPGVLLALGSALLYAIYIPTIGRLQRGIEPAAASAYILAGAGVTFFAIGAATGAIGNLILPSVPAWLAAGGVALLSTAIAFIAFLRALPVLGSVRTAIICTVEPFYTAVAAALLFGQPLTMSTIAGGMFIAAAVVLLQRK